MATPAPSGLWPRLLNVGPGGGEAGTGVGGREALGMCAPSQLLSLPSHRPLRLPLAMSRLKHLNRDDQLLKLENPVTWGWPFLFSVFFHLFQSHYTQGTAKGDSVAPAPTNGKTASSHSGHWPVSLVLSGL